MAKVSAHGREIGTVEYLSKAKRYMQDGKILINNGHGWKLGGKIKPGFTPAEAFAIAKSNLDKRLADQPCFAAYRAALHNLAGLGKRWSLALALSHMPDDPDGVWSEACDGYGDNVHADVDEISDLCRLYKNALAEAESLRVPAPEAA